MKAFLLLAALAAAAPAPDVISTVVAAAEAQTKEKVVYDGAYVRIPYSGGDVPAGTGVCTDVVIRAYRKAGIDLQKEVHEDMKANFGLYPKKWGRRTPDTNIDHRRVPNLMTFFSRKGKSLPVTRGKADYEAGDLVTWDLNGRGLTHIGVVVPGGLIVHNIGAGPQKEDVLFSWKITGHYRYAGK